MVLAGSIIALYFHGLAGMLRRKFKVSPLISMILSLSITFIILSILGYMVGAKLQTQIADLTQKLPEMFDEAKKELSQYSWGRRLIEQLSSEELNESLKRFYNSTFGVLGDIYVILFLIIFFTSNPYLYVNGIMSIVPHEHKNEGHHVLNTLGLSLRKWFKARLIAMGAVAIMTSIGLTIIGVPMIVALSVISGILTFIPNFGPALALVIGMLVGLTEGINTALMVGALYLVVQFIESTIITPKLQLDMVSLPPAFIIIGQLVMGAVAGYLGVIMAMPVVLIIMILINKLYVKRLDD